MGWGGVVKCDRAQTSGKYFHNVQFLDSEVNNMSIPYGKIKPVSVSQDKSWKLAFDVAQAPALPLLGMEARRYKLVCTQHDILKLGLHQVYRRHWDSKHKFPCRLEKLERQAIEIYGNYWWELLKMAERLHSHQDFGKPYPNAASWFKHIVMEYRGIKINSDENVSKTDLADLITKHLQHLRNYENPFDPDLEPHLVSLVNAAISLAEKSDQFKKRNWEPFLRAYTAWRDDLKTNSSWYAVVKSNDGKYYNQGKGRVKIPTFRDS